MNIVCKYTYLRNKDSKKREQSSPFLCPECVCSKKNRNFKVFQNKFKNMYEKHHILLNICRIFYIIHIEKN